MITKLFIKAFVLLVIVSSLFFIGNFLYLSWTVWWFDSLLHFLGGLCISMGGIAVWLYVFNIRLSEKTKVILIGLGWAIFIGVLWEVFEVRYNITFISDGIAYVRDTSSDLVMDICGGFFGTLYGLNSLQNNE